LSVFEDPRYASGVRLVAARIAMARHADAVHTELLEILRTEDPTFLHRDQIAQFFGLNPVPSAAPVLAEIAKDPAVDRDVRRACVQALGSYDAPAVVEALKEIASLDTLGDLRAESVHALHKILGENVLDFIEYLRPKLAPQDTLRTLLDNIESHYRGDGARGG
jgi:HEAT repeat protein